MKREVGYITFSVLFLLATVGIIGWIVKDEIDAGARERQQQLTDNSVEDNFDKNLDISPNGGSEKINVDEPIENKADAKKALDDVDTLMNSVEVDELSR